VERQRLSVLLDLISGQTTTDGVRAVGMPRLRA
jgi:hypothetical protein